MPVKPEGLRDALGESDDPVDLLAHGPEAVVKDDPAELVETRVERALQIFSPKETRVGQARAHHAVCPLGDDVRAVGGVHDGEVVGEELVLALLDAEVLLMPSRDRPDDRGR